MIASRRAWIGAVGALAITAVLLGPPAAAHEETGPPLQVPADVLDRSLDCRGPLDTDSVLLVPGTGATPEPTFGWNYARVFAAQGRGFCTVELPENATADIQIAAEYVVHALRTMRAEAGGPVDVIGWSQGGMVPRWALKFWPDTRAAVDDLIGLAPSNHGTLDAEARCTTPCAEAVWQQRREAEFLRVLNADTETYPDVDYTVAYTESDQVIIPAAGSRLWSDGGDVTNVTVQEVCPGHVADHFAMGSFDPVGYAIAADALDHDGAAEPDRVDRAVCLEPFMPGVDPATFPADFTTLVALTSANIATAPKVADEPEQRPYARDRT